MYHVIFIIANKDELKKEQQHLVKLLSKMQSTAAVVISLVEQ